ncbi:hypothetical protein ANN_28081 [Periplaneta americana]|uniref:THAP-type domain-containing protein n=1 Tax=Periplaneta americana TaxID=6978 RepID=A0ABQ8RV07_PERAM|nr:hypothetical protein ANN_28081 [Periplaneta americana]
MASETVTGQTERFPNDPERKEKWVKALRRENWAPTAYSCVCSVHFKECDFDRTSLCRVRVKEVAVPSVFPSFPPYLQKEHKELHEAASGNSLTLDKINILHPEFSQNDPEVSLNSSLITARLLTDTDSEVNVAALNMDHSYIPLRGINDSTDLTCDIVEYRHEINL